MGESSWIDLYHRTTEESARAIYASRRMTTKHNRGEAYFSNTLDGQATGYGVAVVHIRVPAHLAQLDDEFPDGECHYIVSIANLRPEHFRPALP